MDFAYAPWRYNKLGELKVKIKKELIETVLMDFSEFWDWKRRYRWGDYVDQKREFMEL